MPKNLEEQLWVKPAPGFHSHPFSLPTQESYEWVLEGRLLCSLGYSAKNEK